MMETVDYDAFARQQILYSRRTETFGGATALYECTFEKDNGLVPQMAQARQYADHWQEMRQENLGLLLWGQPGNGKTFAAASIANALLERGGREAPRMRMTTLGTVLSRLPGMTPGEKESYFSQFFSCELLILDDFGMERQTDYAREQVFNLIDGRYLARRPLIVTTNLSLNQLKSTTNLAEKRIYDRILELCVPVFFGGESQRPARAKANLDRFRAITAAQSR